MIKTSVQQQLEQPEIQEAIISFLQKLPTYEKNLNHIGQIASFIQEVLKDRDGFQQYDEILRTYQLNLDTIEAIIGILEKLPRLNQLLDQLLNIADFITSILQDDETKNYIVENLTPYMNPMLEKGRESLSLFHNIQQEAKSNSEPIKLMSLLKCLKDPSVQQSLKYVQAAVTVFGKSKQ